MKKSKKYGALLSSAIIALFLGSDVNAKVISYGVNYNGRNIRYNSKELIKAYEDSVLGKKSPMWDSYEKVMNNLFVLEDDKKGFVSYKVVEKKYVDALVNDEEITVDSITENAKKEEIKNIEIHGEWKDGEIKIYNKDEVSISPNENNKDEIKTEEKPSNNGNNNTQGNTSDSNSSESNPQDKENEKPPIEENTKSSNHDWIDLNKSGIRDVQYVYYGIINLKEGKANDYEFYLDNEKLYYSKVNMEGTIIKFQLKDSKEKTITIKKADKIMHIILKPDESDIVKQDNKFIIDEVRLKYSTDVLVESEKNEGSIEGTIDVSIDSSNKNIEFVDGLSSATFTQMPKGVTLKAKKIDNKTWRFYVEGKADKHNENDNTLINIKFTEKCFSNLDKDTKFIDMDKNIKIIFKNNITTNPIPEISIEEYKFINKDKSRIMDIQNVLYGVIVLKEGNINDYEFYLDGSKVNIQKVNSEGTIIKFEIKNLSSQKASVKKADREETIILNK